MMETSGAAAMRRPAVAPKALTVAGMRDIAVAQMRAGNVIAF